MIGVESSEAMVLHYWRCVVSSKAVRFGDLKAPNEQRDSQVANPLTWTFTVHRCRCRCCPSLDEANEIAEVFFSNEIDLPFLRLRIVVRIIFVVRLWITDVRVFVRGLVH